MFFCKKRIECFIVSFLLCFLISFSLANEVPPFSRIDSDHIVNLPLQWEFVPVTDYPKVLKFLLGQNQGNVTKIKTLSGIYSVEFSQHLTPVFMSEIIGLSESGSKGGTQTQTFDLEFAVNTKENCFYRKKTVTGNNFRHIDQLDEIKTKDLGGREHISIEKNNTLTELDLLKQSAFQELPDYPDLREKNVARMFLAAKIAKLRLAEYVDPLEPLNLKFWEPLDVAIRASQSTDAELVKKMATSFFIYEAIDNKKNKWYAIQVIVDDTTFNRRMVRRTFWNESVGFNPVGMSWNVLKSDTSEELSSLIIVTWQKYDAVFIPEKYLQINHQSDGTLSFSRLMSAKKLEVNIPLRSTQFASSALGLKEGDYVLDEIHQQVFTIQNDKPVYLAKFYEKYQTPHERSINRVRTVMMIAGFVLIVLGLYLKIRRKRSEKTPK